MRSLVAFLVLILSSAAAPAQTSLLDPSVAVGGRSQAEWSQLWWQWAASFDRSRSPVADKTGALCHLEQEGPVWFLAGTYGTQRTIRTCEVPRGKYLFFPLVNYVFYPAEDGEPHCEHVRMQAAQMTDNASSLVLEIDGVRATNLVVHRQAPAKCFDLNERAGGGIYPAAANGYYVMLAPLKPGTHTLNFGGVLPRMSQAVTYTIRVR